MLLVFQLVAQLSKFHRLASYALSEYLMIYGSGYYYSYILTE